MKAFLGLFQKSRSEATKPVEIVVPPTAAIEPPAKTEEPNREADFYKSDLWICMEGPP